MPSNLPRYLIRILAFLRKEIVEVIRQPMLVVSLVLGPFLILLFFGIGYRNEPRALRTVFVTSGDQALNERIEQYAGSLGTQLIFSGITDDLAEAEERLLLGEVDLITVVPDEAYQIIQNNEQAVFELRHQEIDPFQTDYINVFGRVYIDEINRRILRRVTSEGQANVSSAQEQLGLALMSVSELRNLLEQCTEAVAEVRENVTCDREAVQKYTRDLDETIDMIDLALGDSAQFSEALQDVLGIEPEPEDDVDLAEIIQDTNAFAELTESADDYVASLERLTALEDDLNQVNLRLDTFLDIEPRVLVRPFRSEAQNIAAIVPGVTDFFAPAVIVLLLQHLAVTFAALSMVREHQLGTMELFFVAPLSSLETLLGKYLSYLIFGGSLAAILLLLVVLGLGVPVLGSLGGIVVVILMMLFTAMGIGFIISLISKTDIQAVQYSMIVLLTSVFFSGFFLSLEALWEPVRVISWALPATYGIQMLRDIMLKGAPLALPLLGQLFAIGLGLFAVSWYLLRRVMVH